MASVTDAGVPVEPLFMFAMDHRDSLARDLYGIEGEPTKADAARISAGKQLIFDGLVAALDRIDDGNEAGVLVDERYGTAIADQARSLGLTLAMPIERSGQRMFHLEYGTIADREWVGHVEEFDPAHVKVLVRDNPDDPNADRRAQFEPLATISEVLRDDGRSFLIELLVPATEEQLAAVDGEGLRYDTEVRPGLTARVIADMRAAGIEPHIWKIEGLETPEAAVQIVEAARAGGNDEVRCIVLGRDAPQERLDHWLTIAAGTEGFSGFAIGRSIWEQPLADHLAGHVTDAALVQQISTSYLHYVATYLGAMRR